MKFLNFDQLNSRTWMQIHQILADVGSIMDLSELCGNFFTMIKPLIPFEQGLFFFYDHEQGVTPKAFLYNVNDKTHHDYLNYYIKIDDFNRKSFNTPEPKRSTDIMDYSQWQRTEYFNDFHLKNGFYYVTIVDLHYQGKIISSLSLVRNKQQTDFTVTELIYLKLLAPHIANHLYKLMVIDHQKNVTTEDIINIIKKKERLLSLSDREIDVVHYVIKGYNNREISDLLFISPETVKKHLNNIFIKSKTKNRTELLATLLGLSGEGG